MNLLIIFLFCIVSLIVAFPNSTRAGVSQSSETTSATSQATTAQVVPTPTNIGIGVSIATTLTGIGTTAHSTTPTVISTVPAAGTVASTQLPATGPPILAYGLLGLIPVGIRLTKRERLKKLISGETIWEKRQYLKSL